MGRNENDWKSHKVMLTGSISVNINVLFGEEGFVAGQGSTTK